MIAFIFGETDFPKIDVSVKPNKGDVVVFHNCIEGSTEINPDSFGIASLMGFSLIEIDEKGQASFYCVPEEFHYNPIGSVHGGLAATLLDSCNSISAQCNLDKGFIALTTDIKVNYLSQISADTGEIVARGKIDKLGRKVIFLTGELRDMNGKLLATASSTELVVAIS